MLSLVVEGSLILCYCDVSCIVKRVCEIFAYCLLLLKVHLHMVVVDSTGYNLYNYQIKVAEENMKVLVEKNIVKESAAVKKQNEFLQQTLNDYKRSTR